MKRPSFLLLLLTMLTALLLAGCNLDPPKEVVVVNQPPTELPNRSTQMPSATTEAPSTVTEAPTPPLASTSTPTSAETPSTIYRLRTSFIGKSEIAFDVVLNDRQIGTLNTDAESDVTPYVQNGTNTVRVTWENKPGMEPSNVAKLYVESQRNGQDSWNTLFSREVTRESKDTEAEGAFTVGPAP